jgi:acetylornithine/succinyldiaminopimelate/putrescine aminotransferase
MAARRSSTPSKAQADAHLIASYAFPTAVRADLCERFASVTPEPLKKIYLVTTGTEAVEYAIKVARTHGQLVGGRQKNVIVSYEKAFHGRTLGAQQAGGIPALKEWIGNLDPGFVQIPFPDGFWTEDTSFDFFDARWPRPVARCPGLRRHHETYQGGTAPLPRRNISRCCASGATPIRLYLFDEVRPVLAARARYWGYEHYGVIPDLTTWGKGISSSLPIAAVAGRTDLMDLNAPGSASSTHSGSPVCCAAALANPTSSSMKSCPRTLPPSARFSCLNFKL